MKKHFLSLSLLLTAFVFFIACQKETSTETGGAASQGSLQLDAGSGECLPKTVNGVYEVGKALDGNVNYIDVQLDVTQTGSFVVGTDTSNGYFFRAAGVFTSTGLVTVRLKGSGTPLVDKIDNVIVRYGATVCMVPVTVVPAGGGTPAIFTLAGAPNTCTGVAGTITGSYVAGVTLTIANTATINVNVTKTGTYSITTTASNGIVFTGTGSLPTLGAATIKLTASGTPVTASATTIPVKNNDGSSSCNFVITVTNTPVVSGDYFPLTANSWWSYDDPDGLWVPGDSLTRKNINPITLGGNSYRIFQNLNETTPQDSSFYRRVGNVYAELTLADQFTSGPVTFNEFVPVELPIVMEGLSTGQTWSTVDYRGTEDGTTDSLYIRYSFTCTDANATVTLNGKTFTNVYKVIMQPQFNPNKTSYSNDVLTWEAYYAKGVGLIYYKVTDTDSGDAVELRIKNYQVF